MNDADLRWARILQDGVPEPPVTIAVADVARAARRRQRRRHLAPAAAVVLILLVVTSAVLLRPRDKPTGRAEGPARFGSGAVPVVTIDGKAASKFGNSVRIGRAVAIRLTFALPLHVQVRDVELLAAESGYGIDAGMRGARTKTLAHHAGVLRASDAIVVTWTATALFGSPKLDLDVRFTTPRGPEFVGVASLHLE
jgi:hypothetical protein